MNQSALILRKDLRRLRWILVAWCALIAARTFIDTVGADIALGGFGPQLGIAQLSELLSLMYWLLLVFLVSRLVHDEPLVGPDAFWITRPIAPAGLMIAKLAFAGVFMILLPVCGNVIVAAVFGTPAGDIARTIPPLLLNQVIPVTLLMAIAALTPSLARYLGAIVGVIGTFVIFAASMVLVLLLFTGEVEETADARIPDSTPAVVRATLLVLIALAVLIYQYFNRRIRRALAIAAVGIPVAVIVPQYWPWSFTPRPATTLTGGLPDTPSITVSLDASKTRVTDAFTLRRRRPPRKEVATHAIVSGVPAELNVRTIGARSKLELPGGIVLESGQDISKVVAFELYGGSTSGRDTSIEAALGGVRLLTKRDEIDVSEQWPTLLRLDERDFLRYRIQPGRLTANVHLVLERAIARRTLPLADEVTVNLDDTQVTVVRVIRRATGCTVLLRRSYVESLFSLPVHHDYKYAYALVNKTRGEAVGGDVQPLTPQGFSSGWFYLPSRRIGGRGFVLQQYELQFPPLAYPGRPSVDVDEAWLAGAEMVILEVVPAGVISRTVTIEGFRMGGLP